MVSEKKMLPAAVVTISLTLTINDLQTKMQNERQDAQVRGYEGLKAHSFICLGLTECFLLQEDYLLTTKS